MATVTMADVARVAGVHQTTVSLALRNHRSIPESTRERIRKIADEMKYRPNPLVSALVAQRRRRRPAPEAGAILAYLTSFQSADGWRGSLNFVIVFDEMLAHAARRGYRLEEFWLKDADMTPERMKTILLSRGIRGVVVCPMPNELRELDFDFSEFATVALGVSLRSPNLDRVSIDYSAVMSLCVRRLREQGCHRIAFATTWLIDDRVNHLSLGAFLAERQLHPRHFLPPFTATRYDQATFTAWLERTRPDAVITAISGDYAHFRDWMDAIYWGDLPPPQLVCVDCVEADPTQPGVVQNLAAEARAAIDLVTSRVERGQFGLPAERQSILVAGRWRDAKITSPV